MDTLRHKHYDIQFTKSTQEYHFLLAGTTAATEDQGCPRPPPPQYRTPGRLRSPLPLIMRATEARAPAQGPLALSRLGEEHSLACVA